MKRCKWDDMFDKITNQYDDERWCDQADPEDSFLK